MSIKILLLGSKGNLGTHFYKEFSKKNINFLSVTRENLDLTDYNKTKTCFLGYNPDYIINCTGYTNVEESELVSVNSYLGNVLTIKNLIQACEQLNAKLIHFSTDYVFDGFKNTPYKENDFTNPLMIYGKHKLMGEELLCTNSKNYIIFRVSWLFSWYGHNFLTKIIKKAFELKRIGIIDNQYGSPTSYSLIAKIVTNLIINDDLKNCPNEIYHLTNSGIASWYDLAFQALKLFDSKLDCYPIKSFEFNHMACRPVFTPLDKTKFEKNFAIQLPHWFESLAMDYKKIN